MPFHHGRGCCSSFVEMSNQQIRQSIQEAVKSKENYKRLSARLSQTLASNAVPLAEFIKTAIAKDVQPLEIFTCMRLVKQTFIRRPQSIMNIWEELCSSTFKPFLTIRSSHFKGKSYRQKDSKVVQNLSMSVCKMVIETTQLLADFATFPKNQSFNKFLSKKENHSNFNYYKLQDIQNIRLALTKKSDRPNQVISQVKRFIQLNKQGPVSEVLLDQYGKLLDEMMKEEVDQAFLENCFQFMEDLQNRKKGKHQIKEKQTPKQPVQAAASKPKQSKISVQEKKLSKQQAPSKLTASLVQLQQRTLQDFQTVQQKLREGLKPISYSSLMAKPRQRKFNSSLLQLKSKGKKHKPKDMQIERLQTENKQLYEEQQKLLKLQSLLNEQIRLQEQLAQAQEQPSLLLQDQNRLQQLGPYYEGKIKQIQIEILERQKLLEGKTRLARPSLNKNQYFCSKYDLQIHNTQFLREYGSTIFEKDGLQVNIRKDSWALGNLPFKIYIVNLSPLDVSFDLVSLSDNQLFFEEYQSQSVLLRSQEVFRQNVYFHPLLQHFQPPVILFSLTTTQLKRYRVGLPIYFMDKLIQQPADPKLFQAAFSKNTQNVIRSGLMQANDKTYFYLNRLLERLPLSTYQGDIIRTGLVWPGRTVFLLRIALCLQQVSIEVLNMKSEREQSQALLQNIAFLIGVSK